MQMKKIAALILSATLPLIASANINIMNETDSFGTGKIGFSPCSSFIGDDGIMKPHDKMELKDDTIGMFCSGSSCEATIYMTKNCSGKELAKIIITPKSGHNKSSVASVKNFDTTHFTITGAGTDVYIAAAKS